MKVSIIGMVLWLAVLHVLAQKSPIKFGEIPIEDMMMTSYNKDSSAAALILVDYGEAYLSANSVQNTVNFERHVRIKILTKEGMAWANRNIQLRHFGSTEEKVNGLKASTYNLENGKIVETKMSKDGLFKEKFNSSIYLQKFTLPNVKEGSVIEYSYKIMSEFYWVFPNWKFQETIPTRLSEYWAIQPDFFIYEKYMQGYLPVTNYEIKDKQMSGYQAKGHHWLMLDVPAFKEEPYITTEDDYVSKINFALSHINFPNQPVSEIMGSWIKLNTDLLENESFGKVVSGNNYLKKKVEELILDVSDPVQKITAIHNYVKENIEWNGEKDYTTDGLKKIIEQKKGTSGDINLLLASMLQKADFNVDMVLLSTRDHGFIRQAYPMTRQFNYVVCLVRLDGNMIWLDATDRFLPINVLPEKCLNGQGLIISETNHGWVNLETKIKAKTIVQADLVFDGSSLKGKLNFTREGYDAQRMRKTYNDKGQEIYLKEIFASKSWEVEKSGFENIKEINKSAKELHEIVIVDHVLVSGDVAYINPFITAQMESNPFTSDKRLYPVNFESAFDKVYMMKLTIPENYKIDEVPQSKVITLPGNAGKYFYNVTHSGSIINITSSLQINKNLFTQDEYPILREFYNQLVSKQAEQIVLKKK